MTVGFKNKQTVRQTDEIVATALTGVVYTENGRLHVISNRRHLVFKPDASKPGWYSRNLKTSDDFFLGKYVSPTVDFESLKIKDQEYWDEIVLPEPDEARNVEGKR